MEKRRVLRFLYDIDGVLANTGSIVTRTATAMMQGNGYDDFQISEKDLNHWDALRETVERHSGCERLIREVNDLWFRPEILLLARPFPLAPAVTRMFERLGIEQFVATSRLRDAYQITREWMEVNFPWLMNNLCLNNTEFDGRRFKLDEQKRLGVGRFFEDDDQVLDIAMQHFLPQLGQIRLVNQPWNQRRRDWDSHRINNGWLGIGVEGFKVWAMSYKK